MSTTATFIATGVALQASAQNAANHQLALARCETTVKNFTHDGATVEQRQVYASCVQRMHPTPEASGSGSVAGKACVVALVASLIIGAVVGYRRNEYWGGAWESAIVGAFFGLFATCAALLLAALLALLWSGS